MKIYEKPIISVDAGLAEGVYAASGANGGVTVSAINVISDWGNSGQANLVLDLSSLNPSQLTVVLTFNMNISNGWGGGASVSVSGKSLTLNWYSAPSTAEISVQVQGADIKQLQCTGSSYSNK